MRNHSGEALGKIFNRYVGSLFTVSSFNTRAKLTPKQEMEASFRYLQVIDPARADEILEALRYTAGENEGEFHCPSQFSGQHSERFTKRVEVMIRAAESYTQYRINQRSLTSS